MVKQKRQAIVVAGCADGDDATRSCEICGVGLAELSQDTMDATKDFESRIVLCVECAVKAAKVTYRVGGEAVMRGRTPTDWSILEGERDALRAEVERLKALLEDTDIYVAEVERLRAEVERLKAERDAFCAKENTDGEGSAPAEATGSEGGAPSPDSLGNGGGATAAIREDSP